MSTAFQTLATRTLPTPATAFASSCCPTRDLLALAPAPEPSTSALPPPPPQPKVSLWRTAGTADSVWEWVPKPPPTASGIQSAFKGKGKDASAGKILGVAWNPQGSFLAVALSTNNPPPSTTPSSSTINLLSLQNGTSPLPPIKIPTEGQITSLSWHAIQPQTDSLLTSSANSLIQKLPALPTLAVKDTKVVGPTPGVAGSAGGVTGMFGQAKNALLQKEREKEAGRALDLVQSAPGFPTLLPIPSEEDGTNESDKLVETVLLIGDDRGVLHVYLGGAVLLGTVVLTPGSTVVGATVPPSSTPSTFSRVAIVLSSSSAPTPRLSTTTLTFTLPPSLAVFAQQSASLHTSISHAFEAFQEVRLLWDESRRVGKAWISRLADLGKPHGETNPPITQLLLLLLHGRPSKALHDFLASKMNERVLTKWEGATSTALERLRMVTFMSIAPAIEHVVLLLDELRAWAAWPEKFAPFQLDVEWINSTIEVAKEIIRKCAVLERLVMEEEKCFTAFSAWVRYELEKLAQQEGSDIRPNAKFQPIAVCHYIRHCLPESTISPYLNFGPATAPLETNADLAQAQAWYEALKDPEERKARAASFEGGENDESLSAMIRRMKEELMAKVPTSIAFLLHILAGKIGAGMDGAMKRIGEGARKSEEVVLGSLPSAEAATEVRDRIVGEGADAMHHVAWIADSALWTTRQALVDGAPAETSAVNLRTEDNVALQVIDFDFLDDEEIVLVVKAQTGPDTEWALFAVSIAELPFLESDGMAPTPSGYLPITRTHALDSHFPPQTIALNGREGRRVACVLAGEGRRLDVLDVDDNGEEDGDVTMGE
ncbi:anaphase-promoting complex component Cut20/Apc4 [Pseudohyphozyma bogoriensis]|nr:anaphase-promoting complex component Cut20/Apc4 [Pseudohyphozyma bogoriensis]